MAAPLLIVGVQTGSTEAALTTASFTPNLNAFVVVMASLGTPSSSGATTLALSNTMGISFTQVVATNGTSGNLTIASIWYGYGLGTTGTITVTPSVTGSASTGMTLSVYSAGPAIGGVRAVGTSTGSNTVTLSTTPKSESTFIMGLLATISATDPSETAPAGYTAVFTDRPTGAQLYDTGVYINPAPTSTTVTFGGSGSTHAAAVALELLTNAPFVGDPGTLGETAHLTQTGSDSAQVTETTTVPTTTTADVARVTETAAINNNIFSSGDSGRSAEHTSIAISPGSVSPPDTIEFRAYNAALTSYVIMSDFTAGQLQDTYSDVGYGSISYPKNGNNFGVLQPLGVVGIAVNGIERLRYIIEDIQGDDLSEQGSVKTFAGRSVFAYLERAIVYPAAWPAHVPVNTSFTQQTPGTIWRTLVQAAQTRGTIPLLDVSSFTGTTDSNGTPWPQVFTLAYSAGTSYLQAMQNMVQSGQVEAQMVGFSLRLYVPGSGIRRPDTVIIQQGNSVTEATSHQTTTNLGTVQLAGGDNNAFVEEVGASVGTLGRYERFTTFSGVGDAGTAGGGTLGVLATATVNQTDFVPNELTVGYSIISGPKPYQTYGLGDWIWYEVTGTPVQYRCRQITLSIDQNGSITAGVTLSDLITERGIILARQVANILGGATGAISQPVTPGPDDVAPAAPTGAQFSSAAYIDPLSGQTFANVALQWVAPTTNADGSALTDLAGYLAEWHYVGDGTNTASLLDLASANFETGIGTWTSATAGLKSVTNQSFSSTHSMQVTSAGGGTVTAITGKYTVPDSTRFYQGAMEIFTTSARQALCSIVWYDISNAVIAQSDGSVITTVANNWTPLNLNVQCPAGAVKLALKFTVIATTISEIFYVDFASVLEDTWNVMGFVSDAYNYVSISPVATGRLVECRVAAVDSSNNVSTWDTTTQLFTAVDALPPNAPSTPQVTPVMAGLKVTWDGLDSSGVPMPADFDHLAVYYNTTDTFTNAMLWDSIKSPSGGTTTIVNLQYSQFYYVFLVAYDITGNVSSASDPGIDTVSLTVGSEILHVNGLAGGDITSLQADVIVGGILDVTFISLAGLLVASGATTYPFGTPLPLIQQGARIELDNNGIRAYDATSTSAVTGQIMNFDAEGNGAITGATIQTAPDNSTGLPFWQITASSPTTASIFGYVGQAGESPGAMEVFNLAGLPTFQFTSPSVSGQVPAIMSLSSSNPSNTTPPAMALSSVTGIVAAAMAPTASTMVSQPTSNTTGSWVNFTHAQWPSFTFVAPPSGRVIVEMFTQAANINTLTAAINISCTLTGNDSPVTFVNQTTNNAEQPSSLLGIRALAGYATSLYTSAGGTKSTPDQVALPNTSKWFIGFSGIGTQAVNITGGGTQVGLTPGATYTVQPVWNMSSGTWWTSGATDTTYIKFATIVIEPQM